MRSKVGSVSKSRLTARVLNRVAARTEVLSLRALHIIQTEMGPDAKVSTDATGQIQLLAYQAALMEEQLADIKEIKDKLEV